jgi:hypothetical protein
MAQSNYTTEEADKGTATSYENDLAEIIGWDDLRFPLSGENFDISSGRVDTDYFNGTVIFANNARYPDEPGKITCQMPHRWKEGSEIRPHIHWKQQSANEPNWLLAYKIEKNGEASAIETDYSNYTLLTKDTDSYTYVSGVLNQITNFGSIDMTDVSLSDHIIFLLFRDTENTSGEFSGSDPSSLAEHMYEIDVHYQIDQDRGSRQEFIK